jgi:hypothetical protein
MLRIGLLFVLLSVAPVAAQSDSCVLTGSVQDRTGTVLPSAIALLSSISVPASRYVAHANDSGVYSFSVSQPGSYTLELQAPGFFAVKLKSIELSSGQVKVMPLQILQEHPNGGCSDDIFPQDIRLLPFGGHAGTLTGRVRFRRPTDVGPDRLSRDDLALLRHIQISLLNARSELLGRKNAKAEGGFQFANLPPGAYRIEFKGFGVYDAGWSVAVPDDVEVQYYFPMEPCPNGNCDPALRPTRPISICE